MLAVDGWHNVLQPLSVLADPNQDVSPLDVLVVINEINGRRYSDTFGNLPDQPPVGERPPYFDVNCNGSVEPLDVLMVINHLNGGPKPTSWNLATANQSSGSGFISAASCSPQLNEGTSLRTELVTDLVIPNENSAVRVTFRQPVFDTASVGQMRDAFEISVRDISGNLLVLPYQPRLEAVVNWSENSTTVNGPAVQMQSAPNEWTSTINLVGIAAGTRAQVSVRLLNNDSDTASNVVVRGVEVIPATGPNPVGSPWSTDSLSANEPIRWPMMQEITGSVAAKYGRTTYINDRSTLIAEVAFENLGSAPIRSAIAVLDNLSHLSIQPLQPDGYTDDGRPYWRIGASSADRILNSNATSQTRGIGFSSTALDRFTFDWRIYGELLQGEVAFQSRPDDVIERGNIYQYQAVASSSLGGSVRYTLMSGPRSVTLSETTGALSWVTTSLDMGRHQFVMRATDDYGNEALQSFSVDVRSQLVNRPPIFTSEPETDAKISSPFEVHTYATGQGPEAATLLPSRFGLMHVVTANSADNQLGLLPSGPFVLGDTQAIGLGERPSSELSGLFEGPMALELGIVPTTEGRYERNVQQVLAEDINGDGNPDAVALVNLQASGNWSDPNDRGFLVVRYGNGDGSFREGWQVQFPTVAGRIGRGATLHYEDVTSDGLKDFVVTTIATNRILVYANTGTGSFDSNPITSPAVGNYVSLTQIADMNRDGKLDLVLFENTQVQIGGRQAISIYHGDGAGRFTEAMVIAEDTNNGGNGYLADIDGVNGPDIIRLNYNNHRLEAYLNNGSGSVGSRIDTTTKSFYAPNSPNGTNFSVNSGYFDDFDSDGKVDALLSGPFGATLMRGQGNGQFGDGSPSGSVTLLPQTIEWLGVGQQSGKGLDLNGDAYPDFLFGNVSSFNNLMIGLGRGDGSFDLSQYSTAFESDIGTGIVRDSQATVYASVADFNRDGVVDVLLGNTLRGQQAGSVGLMLGDQPGTFRAPQTLRNFDFISSFSPTTFGMRETVTGDFNNDGVLDLITYGAIGFGGGFYFAPGNGDGTFGKYEIVFGGVSGSNSLTTLDIDRDGNLDLAWIDGNQSRQAFGLGNGSFQALPSVPVPGGGGGFQNALQVDDFNGDDYPDLVLRLQTGNIDTNFFTRLVVLLYDPVNRRYNTLPDVNDFMTNWPRSGGFYFDEAVGIGDLNGDGKKEIFFFSRSIPSINIPARWVILETTGGPTTDASTLFRKTVIENPPFIPHDRSIYSYVVDDFDGDGINDIAYSGNHLQTTVMFGNGDFTFRDATSYYTHTFQLDSGDFNGDGVTDLVAMWGWGFLSYSVRPYQSILVGRGDGTFSEMNGFTAVDNINLAAIGDFNGDGRDDLAGTPDQTQGVAFLSRPMGVSDVASGDLNGDGTTDVVSIISGLDRVKVNLQKWDDTFERVDDLFTDLFPVAIDLLDVDANGMLDIVTANQQGKSLSILRQVARGDFEREDIDLPHRPSDLILTDLDRDGTKDVLVLSEKDRSLMALLGSNSTLSLSSVLPLGFTPGESSAGDLTGDDIPDIGVSDPEGDRVLILPGLGDGTFAAPITVLGVANPGALAIADMNRDGRQDLVVAQPSNDRVGVLYHRGPGKFTTPQWIRVGDNPQDIVAEDANSDGATDILVVNRGDDTVSLILNRFDPNRLWTYQPTAIDPDGDEVAFELLDAPGGMLLDPATNTIYWAPMPEQLGVNSVVLEASDGRGGATQQGFSITVTAPVAQIAPQFTTTPVTQVAADAVYRYQPNVVHQDQSTLRYSLVQAPDGMTIDPTTGEVQWDPRTSSLKLNTGNRNYGAIEAPDSPSLRPTSVTVEGWYYFEDPRGAVYENLLAKRASATNQNAVSFGLEYYYGTLRAKVGTPASSNSLAVVTAPAPVDFQKWTHVAMTFDDASKTLTLFINGQSVGTAQSPQAMGYNDSPLQSGRNIATLARQRIWNRALTPAEVFEGMLSDVPRDADGLILQWNHTESRDAYTIVDSSSAKNHGYFVGTPDWLYFPTRQQGLASQGAHDVILRVEDGRGGLTEQTFQVNVVPPFQKKISGVVFSDTDGDSVYDLPSDFNRIANGDFSSGFAGWESDFFQRADQPTTGWLANSQATTGPSAAAIPLTSGFGGHTNGSSQDWMLIVNGDNQDRVAWRQSVTLIAGQSYDFSFWAIRPNTYEAARLLVRWNGQALGNAFTLDDVGTGAWKQFRQSFTPTTDRGVIEIVSLGSAQAPNPGLSGTENSFAIDDLMLIPSDAKRVLVPGAANPYLAGMPNGSSAYGSTAPQGSPPSIDVQPGQVLRIRATGHTRSDGFIATRSPDGIVTNATGTVSNALNGISSFASPNHGSLLGVFLDDQAPSGQPAPTGLDFRSNGNVTGGIHFLTLSPELRQLFFVGDGFTSDGIEQTIIVPQGATRLFLANSSSNSWINNTGSLEVQVFTSSGEAVQPGRTVYLDSNRNQAYDLGEPTATTDANGRYLLAATGEKAHVGLVGVAGQVQSTPSKAVVPVDVNTVTPSAQFGLRSVTVNQAPIFLSQPNETATAPGTYEYQVFAQSPKGQSVRYELASGPQGMTLDPVSGLMQWSLIASQAGTHDILIQAFDADRQFTVQRYSLSVSINTPPIVTSTAPQDSQVGTSWQYRVRAQDAEQSVLAYRLMKAPSGMTISPESGIIDYVPSALGVFTFEVEVSDGQGGSSRQSSTVTVVPSGVNEPPRDLRGGFGTAIIDRVFASYLSAIDDDHESLVYSLVQGPSGMTVSEDGQLLWRPSELGMFNVKIAAIDPRGGRIESGGVINVISRAPRPTMMINSSPETAARVGTLYSYDVVAPGAVLFELIDPPVGMSIDPQFGSIRWIPTRDSLGVNTIKIRCTDLFGNAVAQEYAIAVRSSSIVPTISSAPLTEAVVGRTYLYSVRTDNPSSSPLRYELAIAPDGMQIDFASGEISWTPTAQQVGPTTVSVRVSDGLGNFSAQTFAIMVAAGTANRAPEITSVAGFDAVVDQPYEYTLQAVDPEGASVAFGIRSAPGGFSIHPVTGVVTWTPQSSQVGTVSIVLTATDPQGGVAVQSLSIDVRPANRAPEFRSNPVLSVSQGGLYQYDVLAVDPDREPLSYELLQGPLGMTIDSLGRVRWQTELNTPLGGRNVSIRVRDGLGATATQSFSFGVVEDTQAPRLTIVVTGEPVLFPWTVHPAIVRVIATDNVGLTNVELRVDGVPVELAPDGTARVYFSAPGNGRLVATATDAAGNVGTATGRVNMRSGEEDGSGNPAPEASITSVGSGAAVRGFVDIVGTAVSPDFERYKLSYRRIDQTEYTLIRESTTSVSAASLGQWDTTLLENDNYVLKLEVIDTFGSFAGVEVEVSVTGNLKLGNFRLSFEDMTIPVAGIPITIVRTYDTLRADRDGDFGYGWRLEYRNTDLRTSLPKSGLEDIGIYTPFREGTRVFLTLPGGVREGFTFTPEYRVLPGFGLTSSLVVAFPKFTSDRGVNSTLSTRSGALVVNEFGELYASGGIPWNPASPDFGGYTLTTADGLQYHIDGDTGVMTSARDRNGNVITFNETGIFLAGESIVSISRDVNGRIASIQDLSGTRLEYAYQQGRLIGFKDGEGYKTTYRYDSNGRLNELIDPMNRPFAKTTYDAQGRMTSTTNRDGRVIHYEHSPSNRQQVIEDANGAITVLEFDSQGNLVRETDALGGVTERKFDSSGNQTLTRDPLGREIRRSFDSFGRMIEGVDALGATTSFSYDAQGNLLSKTSPLGLTVRYEYDTRGNLLQKIEPDGTISIRRTVDERGNVIHESDALARRTTQEFDSLGRPVAITDPLGNRVELQRRADGIPTERIDALGHRTQFTVDRRGLITAITGPDGKSVDREFNPIGENIGASNGHGTPIQYRVNADGRETLFSDALGNSREKTYDLVGELISSVDALGRITRHEYDLRGRRIKTIYPDGSFISMVYDAVGNLIEQTDELGFKTRFEYDSNDRPVKTIDAMGRITTQQYDSIGRLISVTNPAGRTTRNVYDQRDNLVETHYPDGTRRSWVYDAVGRRIEEIAPDGTRTRMEYDAAGRMVAVIASDGSRTSYKYDKNNRLVAQVDALGRETSFQYNAYGQLTERKYPDGTQETTIYDNYGFIDRIILTDGQNTEQDYDPNGNLIRQRLPDGTEESFTYSPTGKILSAVGVSGTTSFQYDVRDRLIRITQPSGVMVWYEYDAVGNRTSLSIDRQGDRTTTTYAYDSLRRLISTTASSGESHRYFYDPAGNVSRIQYANGITEDRVYDSMNRPTEITSSHSGQTVDRLQYSYTPAGLRESVIRSDGSRVSYSYDSRHRLLSEVHYDAANVVTWQESYEYDAVSNRVAVHRNGQRIPQAFSSLDQLISSGQETYSYDNRGRMVERSGPSGSIRFAYDSEDQLVRVTTDDGQVTYGYDALGNRIRSSVNSAVTEHVLDLNSPTGVSQVVEDRSDSSGSSVHYVFGVLGREMMVSGDGMQTYHYDANGNVRRLHNSQGDSVVQYLTSAFGTLIATAESSGNTFRFTGERTDETLGLVHLRARDYMVDVGQFLTRDPYNGNTGDPTSLHRYLYAHQNPVTNRDPTGEMTLAEQAMVGGLINGLVSVGTSYLGGNRSGGRLFFDFIVGAGFGALSGGLGGTVAKALTNDFMRTAVFANAASTSLFVKYSPRLVYAIPNTFLGVAEDITKGFGTGDMNKPGWVLNVVSNATVNFVFNVVVGPANIDAYEIQKAVPTGYTVGDIGSNFYLILTKAQQDANAHLFREIWVEFGESSFSKAEEYFFQFMSESAKFIAGAAISHANKKG